MACKQMLDHFKMQNRKSPLGDRIISFCRRCFEEITGSIIGENRYFLDEYFRVFCSTKNPRVVKFVFGERAIPKRAFKEVQENGREAFLLQQKYAWGEVEKWKPLAYKIAIKKFGDAEKNAYHYVGIGRRPEPWFPGHFPLLCFQESTDSIRKR